MNKKYKDGLYHKDVYLPTEFINIIRQIDNVKIEFSKHSKDNKNSAKNRMYSFDEILFSNVLNGEIIEIEYQNNKIVKFVSRFKYKSSNDLCAAFLFPVNGIMFCKTIWTNSKNDKHFTLDVSRYVHNDELEKKENSYSIADILKSKQKINEKR